MWEKNHHHPSWGLFILYGQFKYPIPAVIFSFPLTLVPFCSYRFYTYLFELIILYFSAHLVTICLSPPTRLWFSWEGDPHFIIIIFVSVEQLPWDEKWVNTLLRTAWCDDQRLSFRLRYVCACRSVQARVKNLGKLLNISEPCFSPLRNEENDTYHIGSEMY